MRRHRRWLWPVAAVLVVGAVVGGVFAARDRGDSPSFGRAGGQQVELSGPSPITGAQIDLAAYRGKPVVLNIWASWCTG